MKRSTSNNTKLKYIGKKIKQVRKRRGLKHSELAQLVNCSSGHLANIESGTGCSLDLLLSIATALDVPISDLLIDILPEKKILYNSQITSLLETFDDYELSIVTNIINEIAKINNQRKSDSKS